MTRSASDGGTGFVDVQNNGTVGEPLGANRGNCISVNSTGAATLTSLVSSNRVAPGAGQIRFLRFHLVLLEMRRKLPHLTILHPTDG